MNYSIEIEIPDMTCKSCAEWIRTAFTYLNGIISAEVLEDEKKAKVILDPYAITYHKVVKIVEALGFNPRLKSVDFAN